MIARKAVIGLVMVGIFLGTARAGEKYTLVRMWPEAVPKGWCFYNPEGIAVDKAGNVFIVDAGNHRIKKFDSKGRFLTQWGIAGKGEGRFVAPCSIEVDGSGIVYVGDWDRNDPRVQKFRSDGRFIGEWNTEALKSARLTPQDFALDSQGNLFMLSLKAERIAKFTPDGKLVAQWGKRGDGDGEFLGPLAVAVDAYDNVYVADTWNDRVQKFDSKGKFLTKWGSGGEGEGLFNRPADIAFSPSGDVYVASSNAIQRFTPEGKFLGRWQTSRKSFDFRHIAVDSSGKVYITVLLQHCVDVFRSDGNLIETWGIAGTDTFEFRDPGNIAVGPSDEVVVADAGRFFHKTPATVRRVHSFDSEGRLLARWGTSYYPGFGAGLAIDGSGSIYTIAPNQVRKFDADGRLVAAWGEEGSGEGQLRDSSNVAADASGNIYVTDAGNHRVQKFDSDGRFLTTWGSEGTGDGQFTGMTVIAVDGAGDICVADRLGPRETRIQKFRPDGRFVTKWTLPSKEIVAIDLSDNAYSLLPGHSDGVIQKYDSTGKLVASFGKPGRADDELGDVWVMCVDASGSIYVPEPKASGCVKKFDSEGRFLGKWTWEPSSEWFIPAKIAVDKAGMVYLSDWTSVWILRVDPEGKLAGRFRLESLSAMKGRFQGPPKVAVDASGNIYSVDSVDVSAGSPHIQKFDSRGEFIVQWGGYGTAEGKLKYPASIAVDKSGNTYITDKKSHCVHKFDPGGKFIKTWGSKGKEAGQFDDPEGIAVDKAGSVYVCDRENCRIQKFDSDGKFLAEWGKEGSGDGEFHFPAAVALDKEGNVYIADSDNSRIQKFTCEGKFLTGWGEFGDDPGQFNLPLGIAVDSSGNVYVSDSHNHRIQKFAPVKLGGSS